MFLSPSASRRVIIVTMATGAATAYIMQIRGSFARRCRLRHCWQCNRPDLALGCLSVFVPRNFDLVYCSEALRRDESQRIASLAGGVGARPRRSATPRQAWPDGPGVPDHLAHYRRERAAR